MMYSMYCDPLKNIFLFLPDGTSDGDILSLAATTFPEFSESNLKPTTYVDKIHKHATYPINDVTPSEFAININAL